MLGRTSAGPFYEKSMGAMGVAGRRGRRHRPDLLQPEPEPRVAQFPLGPPLAFDRGGEPRLPAAGDPRRLPLLLRASGSLGVLHATHQGCILVGFVCRADPGIQLDFPGGPSRRTRSSRLHRQKGKRSHERHDRGVAARARARHHRHGGALRRRHLLRTGEPGHGPRSLRCCTRCTSGGTCSSDLPAC